MSEKRCYTMPEFAETFGLSLKDVQRKVSNGTIPSFKLGGARRIPADVVDALLTPQPPDNLAAKIDGHIRRLVDAAPQLTREQRDRIAALLHTS